MDTSGGPEGVRLMQVSLHLLLVSIRACVVFCIIILTNANLAYKDLFQNV